MSGSRARLHGVGEDAAEAGDRPRRLESSALHARRPARARATPSTSPARARRAIPPARKRSRRATASAPERVATAAGCSGANFLACAALLAPGDDVLVESPGYDPLPGAAARMLGATRPDLRAALRGRLRPGSRRGCRGAHAGHAARRCSRIPTIPRAPSPRRRAWPRSRAWPKPAGFTLLVDEVYRDTVLEDRPAPAALLSDRVRLDVQPDQGLRSGVAALRVGARKPRARRARSAGRATSSTSGRRCRRTGSRSSPSAHRPSRGAGRAGSSRRTARRSPSSSPRILRCARRPAAPRSRSRVSRDVDDAGPFVDRLFRETGTAVAPGRFFGAPAHFRIAFGGDPAALRRGLETIGRGLARL